jgi:hypothetical protein
MLARVFRRIVGIRVGIFVLVTCRQITLQDAVSRLRRVLTWRFITVREGAGGIACRPKSLFYFIGHGSISLRLFMVSVHNDLALLRYSAILSPILPCLSTVLCHHLWVSTAVRLRKHGRGCTSVLHYGPTFLCTHRSIRPHSPCRPSRGSGRETGCISYLCSHSEPCRISLFPGIPFLSVPSYATSL